MYEPTQVEPPKTNNKKMYYIGGAVLAGLLLLCCCVVVVVIVVVDPFKLNLINRLTGRGDPITKVVSPNAVVYMGVDLLNTTPQKLDRLIKPFQEALKDTNVQDTQSAQNELDKQLQEYNMTIKDDIVPWIGQYAGVGVTSLEMDEYGSFSQASFVIAVESRNAKAADAFLVKLQDGISKSSGSNFIQQTYQGVNIAVLDASASEKVVLCRSGGLILISQDEQDIQDAIDLQKKGGSLGEQANYKAIVNQLPAGRSITFYMNGAEYLKLYESLLGSMGSTMEGIPIDMEKFGLWTDAAFSLSVVDAGLQMDTVVAYDLAKLSANTQQMIQSAGKANATAKMFPEGTLFYANGQRLDLLWLSIQDMMTGTNLSDFKESMTMLEQQIGVNPDTDIFPYMNGEYALGIFPSGEGLLSAQANIDLGFALLVWTSDPQKMGEAVTAVNTSLSDMNLPIQDVDAGGYTLYEISDPSTNDLVLAYGMQKEYLVIGSSSNAVKDFANQSKSLENSLAYQQVWNAFPKGRAPVFYMDFQGFMGAIREVAGLTGSETFDQDTAVLDPITAIAAGATPLKGNTASSTIIIFIKK